MDPKEELRLMAEEIKRAGMFTVFQTSKFKRNWQARVMSVVDDRGEVAILGLGTGKTEKAACADCLQCWACRHDDSVVPNAGSLEELRLKMSIGGRS